MVVEKGDKLQKAEGKLKNHPYDLESWNVLIKDAQVYILLTKITDTADSCNECDWLTDTTTFSKSCYTFRATSCEVAR